MKKYAWNHANDQDHHKKKQVWRKKKKLLTTLLYKKKSKFEDKKWEITLSNPKK